MKRSEQIQSHLNKLLILNCEAEKLFLDALENVEGATIKNFLRVAAYERNRMIRALDAKIRKKGGIPTYPDEVLSTNDFLSSNLKKVLKTKNKQALLTEIGRIQLLDIEKYQKIQNNFEFSESIEALLKSHQDMIVKSLYAIEVHKDFFAKNAVSL